MTNWLTTGLDSLSDTSMVLSSVVLDNTSTPQDFVDLELLVKYTSSAPAAGTKVGDVYIIPALDGTNYGEGSGSIQPQGLQYVGSFESRNGATGAFERLPMERIPIGPYKYKVLFTNTSGKTLASSGNILGYGTWKVP